MHNYVYDSKYTTENKAQHKISKIHQKYLNSLN